MNAARQYGLPGFEFDDYVQDAIAFLRLNEPTEGYFVGFSGGKDSIVTLDLVTRSGVKYVAGYNCTGIDYPEIPRFIRRYYPDVAFIFPKESYWRLLRKNGPPMRTVRWCCNRLKEGHNPYKKCVFGIRAEESYRRAARGRIDTYKGKTTYKPIFHWPEWAVWQYIEENSFLYPSLYDEGSRRIGCLGCPFALCGASEAKSIRRKEEMEKFKNWFRIHRKISREWFERTRKAHPGKYPIRDFDTFYRAYWLH
ncbi:phosphoadenosine phosphosulfate reductase family protein [Desulfovibrio sp. ZJ200]|uniref:phosphoadenosine phosphosulfate reductase domain-containing protein n=1 Tax=Desulfovibrio sp. ZJ200 TaxID=2709792 RepID=UPI0013E9EFF3|nr:phosphoadenosine phosphosulfate reductase family protein [Desulfovibrio sp. ZJ200]